MPAAPAGIAMLFQMAMNAIVDQPLPYVDQLTARPLDKIELIVIHATETPNLALARELALDIHYPESQTGNSGHYYIDLDGRIVQYVLGERVAHHVTGCNASSIGIELVNAGRYPNWFHSRAQSWSVAYPEVQIMALQRLLEVLQRHLPNLRWIARHSDLDRRRIPAQDDPKARIARKLDPGATFPWVAVVTASGLQTIERCPDSPDLSSPSE